MFSYEVYIPSQPYVTLIQICNFNQNIPATLRFRSEISSQRLDWIY